MSYSVEIPTLPLNPEMGPEMRQQFRVGTFYSGRHGRCVQLTIGVDAFVQLDMAMVEHLRSVLDFAQVRSLAEWPTADAEGDEGSQVEEPGLAGSHGDPLRPGSNAAITAAVASARQTAARIVDEAVEEPRDEANYRMPRKPVDIPWAVGPFVNKEHMLEAFADEVCSLLQVPRSMDGYGKCIIGLEALTGRNL